MDRTEAGRKLALALDRYKDLHAVVLALPRGGVPVAREIAAALGAPLDLVLVRKIGVPFQPELAMGAVVDGPDPLTVRNEDVIRATGVTDAEFAAIRNQELAEIRRRRASYLGQQPHPDLVGRTAIVVDDGIATGATAHAALRAIRRQKPARIVLAIPVAPVDTLVELRQEVAEVICLESHEDFDSIGSYYYDFTQISDDEVKAALKGLPVA